MNLTLLQKTLHDSGIFNAIKSVGTECYLVGGAIRDCLNGQPPNDFDFCFPDNPTENARRIADELGATFFILDEERGHSRFVFRDGKERLTCDFAPFRAPGLVSDLRKRDFTVNAMAISCTQGDLELIDPLGGQEDLARKRLRACSDYSFQDDPLRCLKGIRHAVSMGLEFDPATMRHLVDAVPQIDQVASERIRTELARAVASGHPIKTFELLGLTGLHKELFGPSSPESFAAALVLLHDLESVIKALKTGVCGHIVNDYLAELCEENVSIDVALKMSAFFYGYRPVALKSVLNALRFSKRTVSLVEQLFSLGAETVSDLDQVANTQRSRARWLAGLGHEPIASAIFMALVAAGEVSGKLLQVELLIDSYNSCLVNGKLDELVDGDWLTEELGIVEGPEVGRLQVLVHEAEVSGEVTTTEEARKWLRAQQKSFDKDLN